MSWHSVLEFTIFVAQGMLRTIDAIGLSNMLLLLTLLGPLLGLLFYVLRLLVPELLLSLNRVEDIRVFEQFRVI